MQKGIEKQPYKQKILIVSVYHLWAWGVDYEEFNSVLDTILFQLLDDCEIIMGGDMNAQIRVLDCEEYNEILVGPFMVSEIEQ